MNNKRTGDRRQWKRYCISVAIMSMNIIVLSGFAWDSIKKEYPMHFLYYAEAVSEEEIEYEYDDLNRVIKAVYPDGTVILYEYDKNGNILHTTILSPEEPEQTEAATSANNTTESQSNHGTDTITNPTAEDGEQSTIENGVQSGIDAANGQKTETDDETGGKTDAGNETGNGAGNGTDERAEREAESELGYDTDRTAESGNDDAGKNHEGETEEDFMQESNWSAVILGIAGAAIAAALIYFLRRRFHMKKNTKEEGEEENEE